MKISLESRAMEEVKTDLLVLPLSASTKKPFRATRSLSALDRALRKQIAAALAVGDFEAKRGTTLSLYPAEPIGAKRILLVGLGDPKKLDSKMIRRAAGQAAKAARRVGAKKVTFHLPKIAQQEVAILAQAAAEGLALGAYEFTEHRARPKVPKPRIHSASLVLEPGEDSAAARAARTGIQRGVQIAECQNLARDLSNAPGNELPPAALARRAQRVAKEVGLRCQVFDEKQLRAHKMGGILAVGQGSANPPRLVVLEHKPKGKRKLGAPVCIVGKGITFDSGGISLKPGAGMEYMKHDMSGAAAVLGALRACALLEIPVHVIGIISTAENMPSGHAYRPGDVIKTLSGTTIEVVNTDAEGRIVLADALTYAQQTYKPQAIVDLATLTGACIVALGKTLTAMIGTDANLMNQLDRAAGRAAEPVWQLPLRAEHRQLIRSKVADIKNSGGREAGTITAAAFLSEFTKGTPWAHLDIAGTADTLKPGATEVHGATGVGVRLLVELLRSWSDLS